MSILVVDDDPVLREAIRVLAEGLDMSVEGCDSLKAVTEVYDADQARFEFIILDLNLIESGAEDVMAFLEGQMHVPPILLISSSDLGTLDQLAKSGQTKNLPIHSIREKPLDFRLLKEQLADVKAGRLKVS